MTTITQKFKLSAAGLIKIEPLEPVPSSKLIPTACSDSKIVLTSKGLKVGGLLGSFKPIEATTPKPIKTEKLEISDSEDKGKSSTDNNKYNLRKRKIIPTPWNEIDEDNDSSEDFHPSGVLEAEEEENDDNNAVDDGEENAIKIKKAKVGRPKCPKEKVTERERCVCEFCPRNFSNPKRLRQHIIAYHIADAEQKRELKLRDSVACELCSRLFATRKKLEEHIIAAHVVDKEFECPKCGKSFITEKSMKFHVLVVHTHDGFKCKICSRTFTHKHFFKRHLEDHKNSKSEDPHRLFKCEVCNKLFKDKNNLQKHLYVHSDKKPHPCPECPKSFVKRQDMEDHRSRRHGTERPFKCPYCPRAYYKERELIVDHLPRHYDKRDYVCDMCGADFKTPACLNQHKKKFCAVIRELFQHDLIDDKAPEKIIENEEDQKPDIKCLLDPKIEPGTCD